ncbi:MAG: hypothetical protein HUK21_06465 [Fibrobacteraceae bacterium]|nr:hypothetical protein [Fibrobacteraceae bacterium]
MYKKMFFLFCFVFSQSFALTLEQVKSSLKENFIPKDSAELQLRVTVKTVASTSLTDMHIVNKGPNKSYMEIRSSLLNQRSIINGDRMKIIDLATREYKIIAYNGEVLKDYSYGDFNPLDSGKWSAPKYVSQEWYLIEGEAGSLYYNSKYKRVEKIHAIKNNADVLTTFEYDANNKLRKMIVSVEVNGKETTVITEIFKMRNSKDFPDRLFEF